MPYPLLTVCPSGNILHNCSIILQVGNWYWYTPSTIFTFHQFHMHSCMCLLSSVQFYHTCRFVWSQPQSRSRTVPSQGSFVLPFNSLSCFLPSLPTPPQPLATTNLFSISIIMSFQACHINGIRQYVTFWGWLFSLTIVPLNIFWSLEDIIFESGRLSRYACFTGDIQNLVLILEKIKLSLLLVVVSRFESAKKNT